MFIDAYDAVCAGNRSCIRVMKRKRTREDECTPYNTSRNKQKAYGQEQAPQLPVSKRVNRDLLAAINDYSLQAAYAWLRMSIICEMFFMWYVEHSIVPPLDGAYYWNDKKKDNE